MSVNDENDLKGIVDASKVAKHIRELLKNSCVPGVTTAELDELCRSELKALGAFSAPMKDYNAPCYAFYSINNCVVHGLPSRYVLRVGDLVKIDVTPKYHGFIADTACSVVLGDQIESSVGRKLVQAVERSFNTALSACVVGGPVNRIGRSIEASTKASGHFVVPDLAGHGVGRAIHEEPSILNYFEPTQRARLSEGLVIAIEPMISNRKSRLRIKADNWSMVLSEGILTAHYEHTVLISRSGPIVLTA